MAVFTAVEAINIAMRVEQNGQAFYQAAAQQMQEPAIKALLEDLAAWEVEHYKTFQKLAAQISDPPTLSGTEWEQYDLYMQAALENALFKGPDKALAAAEGLQSGEEALRMALGFEKDSMLFYYDLREMMPEAHKETVETIIREERGHALKLANLLRSGKEL
ncbi:MAG: ferritin family protein [Anaerolineae bacterium]|nr:ferritin family protein [Anaerolineae bacterium]